MTMLTKISRKDWVDPIHEIWLVSGREGLLGSNFSKMTNAVVMPPDDISVRESRTSNLF
jgi:hypothetical protein